MTLRFRVLIVFCPKKQSEFQSFKTLKKLLKDSMFQGDFEFIHNSILEFFQGDEKTIRNRLIFMGVLEFQSFTPKGG